MTILWLALITFVISTCGVAAIRYWALRHNLVDLPNERSSHSVPTPRGGGLAILAAFLLALPLAWQYAGDWPPGAFVAFLGGALVVGAVSWLDDLRSLSYAVRLGAHTLAAMIALAGIGTPAVVGLPWGGNLQLSWLALPLALLWIVGLTNAYNFMDGIDGMAGGQGVVAGAGWFLVATLAGQPMTAASGILLGAASLGFLVHNLRPSRIFLGDVGSTFLGYSFAVLALIAGQKNPQLLLAGVFLVWPFVFDTGLTLLRRMRNRENIFVPHRSHFYQRLVIAGSSHRSVMLIYIALALIGVVLALAWSLETTGSPAPGTLLLPLLLWLGVWGLVVRRERRAVQIDWDA